jgi:hypothetical protein
MNLDAEYKKYVEHWGDPIDPINYKLYSIETNMPYFHPDNRLFTKEEFKEQLEKVSPQDTPAIKKIDNITYKEIISEEELKTYKGILEWEDNKKYLILYGTGSYSIVTGSKVDTDEEIIEAYREALKKTLR